MALAVLFPGADLNLIPAGSPGGVMINRGHGAMMVVWRVPRGDGERRDQDRW